MSTEAAPEPVTEFTQDEPDVAIFVDAENVTWLKGEALQDLLERASDYGTVRHRRAYADWRAVNGRDFLDDLTRMGFTLIQVHLPIKGKNSGDIQIAVDVMDWTARFPNLKCVVLVTGDSDFTPVFRRLRERSRQCVGCGPRSVLSEMVMHHCTQFIFADVLRGGPKRKGAHRPPEATRMLASEARLAARDLLARVIAGTEGEVNPSVLKERMLQLSPSFDFREQGFSSFTGFLRGHTDLVVVRIDEHGTPYARASDGAPAEGEDDAPPPAADPVENALRVLNRMGWRPVEPEVLLAVHRVLASRTEGFLWRECVDILTNELGEDHTTTSLKRAAALLMKAELLRGAADAADLSTRHADPNLSTGDVLDALDLAMLRRLDSGLCRDSQALDTELAASVVLGEGTPERVARLVEEVHRSSPDPAPAAAPSYREALARAVEDIDTPTHPGVVVDRMRAHLGAFHFKDAGYKRLTDFLAAHPDLVVLSQDEHGTRYVRRARPLPAPEEPPVPEIAGNDLVEAAAPAGPDLPA